MDLIFQENFFFENQILGCRDIKQTRWLIFFRHPVCWRNTWTGPKCDFVYKYNEFMMFENPSLRKRHYEQAKNYQNIGVSFGKKMGKNHPMVPPFDLFLGKKWKLLIFCQNNQHIERIIFCILDQFWAALWTKNFCHSQNYNFENGVIVKISMS